MPFGEEGVIHAAADVRKGIDEQASKAPQAKHEDDHVVEPLAGLGQGPPSPMQEEHEEASGQKRTEVNLWEDVVRFFVRSCHGGNCALSRYEGSGHSGETQRGFASPPMEPVRFTRRGTECCTVAVP